MYNVFCLGVQGFKRTGSLFGSLESKVYSTPSFTLWPCIYMWKPPHVAGLVSVK